MTIIGTPLSSQARRVMVLGAGELGKEVLIEAQRLGIETIAVDHYANAPAMQVAHRAHVVDMLDAAALTAIIRAEQPDVVIPEVEAIATAVLVDLEADGLHVVPTARATQLTMDREGIRRLAAETLGLPTSPYRFVESVDELRHAGEALGLPCVIKPLMSSSGKGQSVIRDGADLEQAWQTACSGGRAGSRRAIVEGFVDFDFEITLLTIRHSAGTTFCAPIGHRQVDGDYRESWQPQAMSNEALQRAQAIAITITEALGGHGVFGVELFVRGDEVIFSEVSPRPHDTGLVTLISQPLSQFALHVRAVLGLAQADGIECRPAASVPLLAQGHGVPRFEIPADALAGAGLDLRLFGKPGVAGARRVGVALATGSNIEDARRRANRLAESIQIRLEVSA